MGKSLDVGVVNGNYWGLSSGIPYAPRKRSGKGFSFSRDSFTNVVQSKSISDSVIWYISNDIFKAAMIWIRKELWKQRYVMYYLLFIFLWTQKAKWNWWEGVATQKFIFSMLHLEVLPLKWWVLPQLNKLSILPMKARFSAPSTTLILSRC